MQPPPSPLCRKEAAVFKHGAPRFQIERTLVRRDDAAPSPVFPLKGRLVSCILKSTRERYLPQRKPIVDRRSSSSYPRLCQREVLRPDCQLHRIPRCSHPLCQANISSDLGPQMQWHFGWLSETV